MKKIKGGLLISICLVFLSILNVNVYAADTISKYEEQLNEVKKEQKQNQAEQKADGKNGTADQAAEADIKKKKVQEEVDAIRC